jgi:hypothetical protein
MRLVWMRGCYREATTKTPQKVLPRNAILVANEQSKRGRSHNCTHDRIAFKLPYDRERRRCALFSTRGDDVSFPNYPVTRETCRRLRLWFVRVGSKTSPTPFCYSVIDRYHLAYRINPGAPLSSMIAAHHTSRADERRRSDLNFSNWSTQLLPSQWPQTEATQFQTAFALRGCDFALQRKLIRRM